MRAPWAGPAGVLDGTATASAIKAELKERVNRLREVGAVPGLGTILVGEDPGSVAYVAGKHRDCAEIGAQSIRVDLPADATQEQVEAAIDQLNADPACTGYIVQLPLPRGIDTNAVLERIDPAKDADGLHPMNLGRLVLRGSGPIESPLPCTPRAVIELVERYGIDLAGKNVCVVGRGVTVGRSIGLLLMRKEVNATVDVCHTGTIDLADHVRRADVIVAAAGSAGIITPEMVAPGAVVLDVGVSRVMDADGKARLKGDVADGVDQVASWLSPNPGGVGPMTRALLVTNVVEAAERHEVNGSQEVVFLIVQHVVAHSNAGRNKFRYASFHHFVFGRQAPFALQSFALLLRVFELVAYCYAFSSTNKLWQEGVECVMRKSSHLIARCCTVVSARQRYAEYLRSFYGIVAIRFVEVATPKEH